MAGEGNGQAQQAQFSWAPFVRMLVVLGVWFYLSLQGKNKGSGPAMEKLSPLYHQHHPFQVDVFLAYPASKHEQHIWSVKDVPLAKHGYSLTHDEVISAETLGPIMTRNETLYLVTRFTNAARTEQAPSMWGQSFSASAPLLKYVPPDQKQKVKSLVSRAGQGSTGADTMQRSGRPSIQGQDWNQESDGIQSSVDGPLVPAVGNDSSEDVLWVPHFKPNLTISMVSDFSTPVATKLTPAWTKQRAQISEERQKYLPFIYFDEFWLLQDYLVPLNASTGTLTLHLELNTVSSMWWQFLSSLDDSFALQREKGLMRAGEMDELKRVFLEGNPYFLALTFAVSLLHSVFDMLAFKNDIGFWKNNKSMEGLSARTVIINAFCQVVIFFYLLDNETSMVILASSGIGALIEIWKISKVMNITLVRVPGKTLPQLKMEDRKSYIASNTKKYDDEAMRYLSCALFPCVVGYFIYALYTKEYRSWYSFVLESLVGCVYAFGFILMCPQLYLNYKLKSVAHLPWRQMTYKFLNTIIDDLFAFVIKMPFLHRLAVFRDDVVFLIYMYQRWIYRVDKTRVNEFGFSDAPAESGPLSAEPVPPAVAQGSSEEITESTRTLHSRRKRAKGDPYGVSASSESAKDQ